MEGSDPCQYVANVCLHGSWKNVHRLIARHVLLILSHCRSDNDRQSGQRKATFDKKDKGGYPADNQSTQATITTDPPTPYRHFVLLNHVAIRKLSYKPCHDLQLWLPYIVQCDVHWSKKSFLCVGASFNTMIWAFFTPLIRLQQLPRAGLVCVKFQTLSTTLF